jgi:hypothetical protein
MLTFRRSNGSILKVRLSYLTALLVTGCTATPSIQGETASVPVSEIVQRVKCEIWLATRDELANPHFAFLNNWDATVDLTMIVNNQAGVNAGVSIIEPLKNVTIANKGTFGQSFTLGLGGGVVGQANLTDTVSFSLALKELNSLDKGLLSPRAMHYHNECQPFQDADLIGHLRLREWIAETLKPVYDPQTNYPLLTRGFHPSVKGGGGGGKAVKDAMVSLQTLRIDRSAAIEKKGETDGEKPSLNTIDNAMKAIDTQHHTLSEIPESLDRFIKDNSEKLKNDEAVAAVMNTLRDKIKKPPPKQKPIKMNDPLDTISHQVQFIVTWTGNINPAWALFDIKGPNPGAGSFLSGQHVTTHQLLITMGGVATGPAGQKFVNSDVQTVRTIQQFNGALQRLQIGPALQ